MGNIKFKPKRGQIDYLNVRWTPVINCVVSCRDKILLVQRSKNVSFYPGYWNGVSGFLDDKRDLKTKVKDELREEIGIKEKDIKNEEEVIKKIHIGRGIKDV